MKTVVVQAQQKWECIALTRHTEATLTQAINEAGQQGWELVNAFHYRDAKGSYSWTAFLKRPAAGQSRPATPGEAVEKMAQETFAPNFDPNDVGYDVKSD